MANVLEQDLTVLKLTVLAIGLTTASLIFRSDAKIANRPIKEDAFYSFTVAKNIASGKGTTIDGTTLTNGFQPLFTFLTVPAFFIGKGGTFGSIRYVYVIHWILFFAGAYVLGLIGRDAFGIPPGKRNSSAFWWVVLIYTSSAAVFVTCFNGLETGFLLFCYAVAWRYYQVGPTGTTGGLVLFGAILGCVVLARIDGAFFVTFVAVSILFSDERVSLKRRLGKSIAISGTAFLISLPWWLYSVLCFGSLMPTSGTAELAWMLSFDRLRQSLSSFFQTTMPILYLSQYPFEGVHTDLIRVVLAFAAAGYLWKMRFKIAGIDTEHNLIPEVTKRTLHYAVVLFAACVALVIWYALSSIATWFYGRYFAPLYLLSCLGLGLLLNEVDKRFPLVGRIFPLVVVIPLLTAIYFLHSGKFISEYLDEQLVLVNNHVPQGSRVGAWQTGTIGYLRDSVTNLDGKVNLAALQSRNDLLGYVQENRIAWLCDRELAFDLLVGRTAMEQNGWRAVARKGQYVLYHKRYVQQ